MKSVNLTLIYKAWLETRWRFFTGLLLLLAISIYTVFQAKNIIHYREMLRPGEHIIYAQYIWIVLYKGYLQVLWILSAVMLALGGLWWEKSLGLAGFTLSLPISRRRLVLVRAAVGAAQALVLALVPCCVIWLFSQISENRYPLKDAVLHSVLYVGAGLIFYSLTLLLSHLMSGEFSVPTLALGLCLVLYISFQVLGLKIYNPFDLMSGKYYLDPNTFLLRGTLPWLPMSVLLIIAILALFASVKIAESRDF
jgi:hypothetical protein